MGYGSGLSAQFGFATETAVGTAITSGYRYYEFLDEGIEWKPTRLDSQGLKAGTIYPRAGRSVISRYTVEGDVTVELADRGKQALLWKHCIGATATTPVQIGTTGAYQTILTPGVRTGLSATAQVGRPQTDGTVKAFTVFGLKIPEWEFEIGDGDIPTLKMSVDGWGESTAIALGTADFSAAAGAINWTFADASTFTLGGTVSTSTAGVTSVSGGSAVSTVVSKLTLTGKSGMATERFGLGNAGQKREQLENDFAMLTGKLSGEFNSQAEIYDLFKSGATTALQLDLAHGTAGTGQAYRLSFILPAIKFTKGAPSVDGPDIVGQDIEFQAYDDETNPPLQIRLVSTDTTF